jgi:ATP-dependent Lon protease
VDIPQSVKNELEIVPVARMEEVLKHALVSQPIPIVWNEPPPALTPPAAGDDDVTGVRAH